MGDVYQPALLATRNMTISIVLVETTIMQHIDQTSKKLFQMHNFTTPLKNLPENFSSINPAVKEDVVLTR